MDKRKRSEILCIKETVKSKKLDFSSFYTKNRHDYLNYCYFCQVNTLQKSLAYTRYLRKARTKYYIHSPFVYQLCENVIFDKRHYYAFDEIEMRRAVLLNSKQIIEITDFGAGSTIFKDNKRIRPNKSEVMRLRCDNNKMKKYFKWKPKVKIRIGLKKTIDWIKSNNKNFDQKHQIYNI